jgi:hypothetical protein
MAQPASGDGTGQRDNFILAALSDDEYAQLDDRLERADCAVRDMICETGEPTRHVYFPTSASREGMVGLPVFLGAAASPNTVFAQIPGCAPTICATCSPQMGPCTGNCTATSRPPWSSSRRTSPQPRAWRRATVSVTAGSLQKAGLISHSRGVISIDDRAGLQEAACDCYGIVRGEFGKLATLD